MKLWELEEKRGDILAALEQAFDTLKTNTISLYDLIADFGVNNIYVTDTDTNKMYRGYEESMFPDDILGKYVVKGSIGEEDGFTVVYVDISGVLDESKKSKGGKKLSEAVTKNPEELAMELESIKSDYSFRGPQGLFDIPIKTFEEKYPVFTRDVIKTFLREMAGATKSELANLSQFEEEWKNGELISAGDPEDPSQPNEWDCLFEGAEQMLSTGKSVAWLGIYKDYYKAPNLFEGKGDDDKVDEDFYIRDPSYSDHYYHHEDDEFMPIYTTRKEKAKAFKTKEEADKFAKYLGDNPDDVVFEEDCNLEEGGFHPAAGFWRSNEHNRPDEKEYYEQTHPGKKFDDLTYEEKMKAYDEYYDEFFNESLSDVKKLDAFLGIEEGLAKDIPDDDAEFKDDVVIEEGYGDDFLGFNEWLYNILGITSDDMTDDDYDYWYSEYTRSMNDPGYRWHEQTGDELTEATKRQKERAHNVADAIRALSQISSMERDKFKRELSNSKYGKASFKGIDGKTYTLDTTDLYNVQNQKPGLFSKLFNTKYAKDVKAAKQSGISTSTNLNSLNKNLSSAKSNAEEDPAYARDNLQDAYKYLEKAINNGEIKKGGHQYEELASDLLKLKDKLAAKGYKIKY